MVNKEFKSNLLNALRDLEVRDAVLEVIKERLAVNVKVDSDCSRYTVIVELSIKEPDQEYGDKGEAFSHASDSWWIG